MVSDLFKRMNVPSRSSKKGFLHSVLTESFVGKGIEDNRLFPVTEVSNEKLDQIVKFVGDKGVSLSKLASFLGMHYMEAAEVVRAFVSLGIFSKDSRDYVILDKRGRRSEGMLTKELLVWESNDNTHSSRKKCSVHYVLESSGIRLDKITDSSTGEDVTDRVFVPKSVKEEFTAKGNTSYERMKSRRLDLFR